MPGISLPFNFFVTSKFIVYQYTDMNDTLDRNGLWKIPAEGAEAKQVFRGLSEHPKWSPDGSITSALAGIAIREGFITDKDQKMKDFFPEINWESTSG